MNWDQFKWQVGQQLRLDETKTVYSLKGTSKDELRAMQFKGIKSIAKLQYRLYAEKRQSLLVILQGMDGSGKDGTIRHIMSGVNPQGVQVHSFKHPTGEELEHDYLWRHQQKLPDRGEITIFNRSQYENVLISKVHPELVLAERLPNIDNIGKINTEFWATRYGQINRFEENIVESGTQILKFFLHLSKEEQRDRFLERIDKRKKNWKFSAADIAERNFWKAYQEAYEAAISGTSTSIAPWYIIPADDKTTAHLLITGIILRKLKEMDPALPDPGKQEIAQMKRAKKQLLKEAGR